MPGALVLGVSVKSDFKGCKVLGSGLLYRVRIGFMRRIAVIILGFLAGIGCLDVQPSPYNDVSGIFAIFDGDSGCDSDKSHYCDSHRS